MIARKIRLAQKAVQSLWSMRRSGTLKGLQKDPFLNTIKYILMFK
jgi:hypothetical protein